MCSRIVFDLTLRPAKQWGYFSCRFKQVAHKRSLSQSVFRWILSHTSFMMIQLLWSVLLNAMTRNGKIYTLITALFSFFACLGHIVQKCDPILPARFAVKAPRFTSTIAVIARHSVKGKAHLLDLTLLPVVSVVRELRSFTSSNFISPAEPHSVYTSDPFPSAFVGSGAGTYSVTRASSPP